MHLPSARAIRTLDRYYVILVLILKHLILAECVLNITYSLVAQYIKSAASATILHMALLATP